MISSKQGTTLITRMPVDPNIRFPSPGGSDPYARLMAGICRQALVDVKSGHEDAAWWLLSDEASEFFEILGVDSRKIHDFIDRHFNPEIKH